MIDRQHAKVLVTGGTGFAGSHLVEALVAAGYAHVHVTCISPPPAELEEQLTPKNIHRLDLRDQKQTEDLIKQLQPDVIFHLAAFAFVGESFSRARELFDNNITLQLNLLEAIKHHSPNSRVMVVGSAEEYGLCPDAQVDLNEDHPLRPVNPYAVSKVTQDLLAYAYFVSYDLDIVRVRPFNHIGERQTTDFAVPAFVSQIVAIERGQQPVLKVGNLEAVRDFTDVKDMVKAYIQVVELGEKGQVYNIGTGSGVAMSQLVEQLCSLATTKIMIEVDQSRLRPLDIPRMVADNSKIRTLEWAPTIPLDQTLARVMAWYRANT